MTCVRTPGCSSAAGWSCDGRPNGRRPEGGAEPVIPGAQGSERSSWASVALGPAYGGSNSPAGCGWSASVPLHPSTARHSFGSLGLIRRARCGEGSARCRPLRPGLARPSSVAKLRLSESGRHAPDEVRQHRATTGRPVAVNADPVCRDPQRSLGDRRSRRPARRRQHRSLMLGTDRRLSRLA